MKSCDKCTSNACYRTEGLSLKNVSCPAGRKEIISKSLKEYENKENAMLAKNAALVESEGYCNDIRLIEIIKFANKCNYKTLGIAFCIGLAKEAAVLAKILENHGFEVKSVICKFSNYDKTNLDINELQKNQSGNFESICNPIGQAMLLNEEQTDFNIAIGLCVGHDSLFFKYSKAPVTVFAVKDRVLGHNPLAAVYTSETYYRKKLFTEN